MVSRATHPSPSTAFVPRETPRVTLAHRLAALVVIVSISIPPGATYSAPVREAPLSSFVAERSADAAPYDLFRWPPKPSRLMAQGAPPPGDLVTTWRGGRQGPAVTINPAAMPAPHAAEWKPADSSSPLAPPDGIPLQAPFPAEGAAQVPGVPLEVGKCIITGEVSDASSLNPVPGAIIDVVGTGRGAESDASGKFRIDGLPPGTYSLEAAKLGYFSETTVTTAIEAQPAEVRFGLRLKPADDTTGEVTLEEETIVGEYQGESQGDFNLTLNADTPVLTSGVNRDDFAKAGDSDAGDAIAKVSGANIVDGKYAVVRGLADRYVTTTFNGAQIASADPSRKAVQLDLFPTNVIESINVAKTYSPNLPADFGGAAIDIVTRAFPEERVLNLKFKTEWNSATDDLMYVHPERSLGFFGDTGKPLPPILESTDPVTGAPVFLTSPDTPPDELRRKMEKLHLSQDLLPRQDEAELEYSYGLSYGETFKLRNDMKFGFVSAFAQSSGDSNNTSDINNQDRSYIEDSYERGVELSSFLSGALQINDFNTVQVTYFNKHDAADTVTQGRRITGSSQNYGSLVNYGSTPIVRDTYGADAVYFREFWDIETVERDLEILQAKGSHRLKEDGIKFDWSVTESESSELRPHSSHFEYGLLDFSKKLLAPYVAEATGRLDQLIKVNAASFGLDPATATWANSRDTLVGVIGEDSVAQIELNEGLPLVNGKIPPQKTIFPQSGLTGNNGQTLTAFRRIDSTREESSDHQVGITIPIHFGDPADNRLFEIGIGGSKVEKTREVTARVYGLVTAEANGNFSFPGTLDGLGSTLVDDPSGISDSFTGDTNTGPYYRYGVGDAGVENIDTELSQNGLFVSGRLQLEDFYLAAGVRQEKEQYEIDVASAPLIPFTDDQVELLGWELREDQEALLPSFATGTSFFDKSVDVMFAWSRTVARPTFWEFLPTTSTDQSTGIVRRGNVGLDHTTIENFDLSATLRPADSFTIRTSLFHKKLDRPLVQVFAGDGIIYKDFDAQTNTPYTADINGVEIEAEISELGPFSLKANFTYIDAILNYVDTLQQDVTSQLPFQPSIIANATLGYEYEPWKLTANLIYNFTGDYPVILKENPDQSEVSRLAIETFDFILAKRVETDSANYTLKCGVRNILGADDTYIYDGRTYANDELGRTFFFEVEASF